MANASDLIQKSNSIPYEFGKKFFPSQINGKLDTLDFLDAAKGIANLVSQLGAVFAPLYNDISNNIEKIKKCYDRDPKTHACIEDLIICEKSANNNIPLDALLWLQRALNFILIFFQNMLNDKKKLEGLEDHISSAYSQTLEPYHGWISRNLFKFFKKVMPKRSDLLLKISGKLRNGNDQEEKNEIEEVLKFLDIYFQGLRENVEQIKNLYDYHNLNSDVKV